MMFLEDVEIKAAFRHMLTRAGWTPPRSGSQDSPSKACAAAKAPAAGAPDATDLMGADSFLVMAHVQGDEVRHAKAVLDDAGHTGLEVHPAAAAPAGERFVVAA